MRNIIVKVPTLVFFLGLVAGPLTTALLSIYNSDYYTWTNLFILEVIQWGVIVVWMSGIVSYFSYEGKSYKNNSIIYTLIAITTISSFVDEYLWQHWFLHILALVSFIVSVILITPKIKKVFYARATWFIVIELLLIVVGFLTLTPEIKRWEKSDKS